MQVVNFLVNPKHEFNYNQSSASWEKYQTLVR